MNTMTHNAALMLLMGVSGLLSMSVGCGDALEARWGAYVGKSTTTTRTNAGMRTTELEEIISLTPKRDDTDDALWVAISDRCILSATLDGDALTISEQTCELAGPTSADTWRYTGGGSLEDGGALKLGLSGSFERVYKDGSASLEGTHESAFEGTRR